VCVCRAISPIAQGAFSQVARARHLNTQREIAVKTFVKAKVAKEAHLVQAMKNELDVLKALQPSAHPNIANIIELLDTKSSLHAILEYCGGGSLQRTLANRPHATGLAEREVIPIAAQVCGALAHMHGLGIAHRDIKPENVLFLDSSHAVVKICDFGFAVACGTRRVRTVCGSPQYMAPELSRREPYHAWAVDMWAFGALVFEMLEGKSAFRGSSMEQLNIRIMRASHEAFTAATPQPARSLIKALICIDVDKRLPACDALAHPWLADSRYAAPVQ
jgi:serine/threonine protein kinase